MNLTAKQIQKKITPEMKRAAQVVLLATTHARMEREKIDKMDREILDEGNYVVRPEFAERSRRTGGRDGERITDPKLTYLMSEEQYHTFSEYRDRSLRAMGYELAKGYCPALMAEEDQRQAERALCGVCESLVGLTADRILRAPKAVETYKKYIDLLLKLIVNTPGFTSPLKNGRIEITNA